jgi:insertion element IS1 protein InsB
MINILFKCHCCNSINVVRNGYNILKNGKRNSKYFCKDCGSSKTIEYIKRIYSKKQKDFFISLHNARLSLRNIEKYFRINVNTMIAWIRRKASLLPDLFHNSIPPAKLGEIIELDEVWSYIYSKAHVRYVWICISRLTKLVIAYYIGDRSNDSCKGFKAKIPKSYLYNTTIHSDMHTPYITNFSEFRHYYQPTKKETNNIESFNSTIRSSISTMIRKTKSFAKAEDMFEARLKIFFHDYNGRMLELLKSPI